MKTSRFLRRCMVTTHENRRNDGQQLRPKHPRPLDVQEHGWDVTSVVRRHTHVVGCGKEHRVHHDIRLREHKKNTAKR
jgi:hypothetical protein